ncbi:30S ribosomal protein S15 [Candidatus Micrarchaeota archaeon]|nr:30S ribosomal protein S15 [Candidatus Micrarchaeota archaeon]MBU1939974.1 30S ribosomal protein S15 [Candidatus Micrarchaeota archaeon]
MTEKKEDKTVKKAEEKAAVKADKKDSPKAAEKEKPAEKKKASVVERKAKTAQIKRGSVRAADVSARKQDLEWVDYKPEELEQAIVNMANEGQTASEIGMVLRDQYGVPKFKKLSGRTIEEVLGAHKLLPEVPRDLLNLIRRSVVLQKHMEQNKKDFTAKRGYQLTVSKIRRLVKYYHKKSKLPEGWRYTPETAALLVK